MTSFQKNRTQMLSIVFATLTCFNTSFSMSTQIDSNINKAIVLKLPTTNNTLPMEVLRLQKKMTAEIAKANYANALTIAMAGLEKYPNNFLLQTYFAMILGDYAVQCDPSSKQRMLEKSKLIFKKLMPEVAPQPKGFIFYFKNEYYVRFGEYKSQYENGVARVNAYWGTNEWLATGFGYYPMGMGGYYAQGVGASNYAYELSRKGNQELAKQYAEKSLIAWAQCFSYDNTYYNAYVHYAMALGILGKKEEMLRALQRGADLIHEDLNYPEFKNVIELINQLDQQHKHKT